MGQEEPHEIVVTDSPIMIEYSHNLPTPIILQHVSPNGYCFSRSELVNVLVKQYAEFNKQGKTQFSHEQLLLKEVVYVKDNLYKLVFLI